MAFKLRLKETTLDQLLKYSSVMISIIGLTLEQPPLNMSWKNRFKYSFSIFLFLMWFFVAPIYHIMIGLESRYTEVFNIMITGSLPFNKAFWFYINRNSISAVCAHARTVESATGVPARDLKRAAVTSIFFTFSVVVASFVFIIKPFLNDERKLPERQSTFPGLHPALESPNYEISIFIYGCGLVSVTIFCIGYRVLFASLNEYGAARIRLIGTRLEQLNSSESKSLQNATVPHLEETVQDKLGKLINRHQDVIHLVDMMRSIYDTVIGIDFALIFVALTAILITFETSDKGLSARFSIYLLSEILMYCYCGQHLIDANEDLQRSIYACGWEDWKNEKSLRRAVLMMQRIAQRPLGLTAAKKLPLSYDTFQAVMRSCYTFIAAMKAKN